MKKKFISQAFCVFLILLESSFVFADISAKTQETRTGLSGMKRNHPIFLNPYWQDALEIRKNSFDLLKNERAIKKSSEESPYIEDLKISSSLISQQTKKITFTIKKKHPHYLAKEISRTYLLNELKRDLRGDVVLPLYGLYHGHRNEVEIKIDNQETFYTVFVETEAPKYNHSYSNIKVENFMTDSAQKPSFDFFLLKSAKSGIGIMDIDGEIRWNYPVPLFGWACLLDKNKVFTFGENHLYQIGFNWEREKYEVTSDEYTNVIRHHGIDLGKKGYLVPMSANRKSDGTFIDQTLIFEIDQFGKVLKTWDLGEIIARHMREEGDDPTLFVREGSDWFHMNAVLYTNKEDNSLIVSSRENFVIKIDYETGKIKWIFGDQAKYWYMFPSLAKLALSTEGLYPVGQHAISILGSNANRLMFFNNGHPSVKHPEGAPEGASYSTSSVNSYLINESKKTAKMDFDYNLGYKSHTRSSAYRSKDDLFTLIMAAHEHELRIIKNEDTPKLLLQVKFSEEIEDKNIWNVSIIEENFPGLSL